MPVASLDCSSVLHWRFSALRGDLKHFCQVVPRSILHTSPRSKPAAAKSCLAEPWASRLPPWLGAALQLTGSPCSPSKHCTNMVKATSILLAFFVCLGRSRRPGALAGPALSSAAFPPCLRRASKKARCVRASRQTAEQHTVV